METLHGLVEHIVYHNENNGYTVLALMCQGDEVMCTGTMAMVNEGEYIRAEGDYVEHATYGRQFRIAAFSIEAPEDLFSIERYLASGAIKGIGPSLAGRIVKKFKEDTFHIIENEPERLSEVKGISERKAQEIYKQFHDKQDMRQAMMFLAKYGISTAYAVKIYNEYGSRLYDIIRENPYQMAEDVSGIGFRLADEIAKRAGIGMDSDYRIRSGVIYVLLQATINGHVYLPVEELKRQAAELLEISEDAVERQLMDLSIDKKIVIKKIDEEQAVYASSYYYMELNTARMLKSLNIRYEVSLREA
ncbi:MAG: helix-hairpin-helix domain-containing protein, partial [Frisingicoccus sp.]|nr:helix-hairpin-helix domain-containing protein [Frisingicoccus sp.]